MGLDAGLNKYKLPSVSKTDRENYVDWRSNYYSDILNKDNKKWKDFETELFYTDDRILNRVIMSSIKETTGDTYSEEGASLVNADTLRLVIYKLKEVIKDGGYEGHKILVKDYYENEFNKLSELLKNEMVCLENKEYTYLYHATY